MMQLSLTHPDWCGDFNSKVVVTAKMVNAIIHPTRMHLYDTVFYMTFVSVLNILYAN